MAREKKKVYQNISLEDAEQAMMVLAATDTQLKKIEAKMEAEKQKITNKYMAEITSLQESKEPSMEILEAFANENNGDWSGKSFDLLHGRIGFRTGTPKVSKSKKFSWDAVTELLRKNFPSLVREKYEPNKEAILALRDQPLFEKVQKTCYVEIVQDETFYVETQAEELATA